MQLSSIGRAAAASALAFVVLSGPLPARAVQDPAPDPGVRAQYLALCAACHGELGDGKGTTVLARQPRSFVAGGFSYGNTPSAIYRSITYGIPGTPMPSHDPALNDAERRRMAEYVIALGPERREVDPKDTVLVVEDRPVIVRGFLPPMVEGAKQHTRGLLIGTTSGATFEYRTDDVRLLGVRQGDFVERSDWKGRGGDPLKPLGTVVYVFSDAKPGPAFRLLREDAEVPLAAKLRATFVRADGPGLEYDLFAGAERVARVEESVRPIGTSLGAGFERSFEVEAFGTRRTLLFDARAEPDLAPIQRGSGGRASRERTRFRDWTASTLPDGVIEYAQLTSGAVMARRVKSWNITATPGSPSAMDVTTVVVATWDDSVLHTLQTELDR